MKKSRLNPRRALIGLLLLLIISSLLPARWAGALTSRPRYLLEAALAPMDHLLKPLADSLRQRPALTVDLGNQEEYQRAMQQIVQLQYRLGQANERVAELSQIRNQLRLVGVGLMPATVTAWRGDRVHPALSINRGSRHGLATGMVVVRGFNLVGRIVHVGPVTSTVGLINEPESYLIVLIKPPAADVEPRQLICQVYTAPGRDELWANTDADDPIRIDDLVHLYDDAWPSHTRGLVVGVITQIDPHPDDPILRRRVTITPIRSLAHLDHVTVIVPLRDSAGDPEPASD